MACPSEARGKKPAIAGFFISRNELKLLRTRIYIDGYNLYYGCLKGTSFKWLDLLCLFETHILPSITLPNKSTITVDKLAIKFFTACILEKAAKASDSIKCQDQYHSALRKYKPGRIDVITGYYSLTAGKARVIDSTNPKKWPRDCEDIPVWKLEEKQSDVNLAIHALKDTLVGEIDHAVIVTNDTDIAPSLEMIRSNTNAMVGLIIPTTGRERVVNTGLAKHAHWVRSHITKPELRSSQLPRVIHGGQRPAVKPISWHAHPDELNRAIELGTAEKGSATNAFKWLTTPNKHYGERTPLDLIETGHGAEVIRFMENWAKSKSASPMATSA
jgi:6-hydroxy-3-succinoylpyridine 3-monooxygenase